WAAFAAANRATLAATPIHRIAECFLMALSLAAIVSFKPETSTPANLLSFAEQEATRQLRHLSAAPYPPLPPRPPPPPNPTPTPHWRSAVRHASIASICRRPSPTTCTAQRSPAKSSRGCFQKFISVPSYRSGTGGRHGARTPRHEGQLSAHL